MSAYDHEAAPAVKDKSLKDDVQYRIEVYFSSTKKKWHPVCLWSSKKKAKVAVRRIKEGDRRNGLEFEYRIVKLTTKKEVVK